MRSTSIASIAFAALVVSLAAPAARAETPPPVKPDSAKSIAARAELVKSGVDHCEKGELEEGLAALNAAWAQKGDPDLAVALASCEMKAGLWAPAAEHLAVALRSKDDPEARKSLEASFIAVRARVGAVKITVSIEGADIFVGDRFAGQSPLPAEVYVLPGTTRISAKKPGYEEIEKAVDVKANGTAEISIDLGDAGSVARARVRGSRSRAPIYVLGALGVAVAGTGAALFAAGAARGSAADDLLDELKAGYHSSAPCAPTSNTGCTTLKNLRSSHDTLTNAGAGLLIGGGALLGATLIYGLWATAAPSSLDRAGTSIGPMITASGGGLVARGTF